MDVMNDIDAEDCGGAAEDSELFFARLLELFVRCDVDETADGPIPAPLDSLCGKPQKTFK